MSFNNSKLIKPWNSSLVNNAPQDDTAIATGFVELTPVSSSVNNYIENRQDEKLNYLLQKGVSDWEDTTTYSKHDYVKNSLGDIYSCKTNNHLSVTAPQDDTANWESLADRVLPSLETKIALKEDLMNYSTSGTANAIVLSPVNEDVTVVLRDGMLIPFKATLENTDAITLNVGDTGVKDLVSSDGTALDAGKIKVGDIHLVRYNLADDRFEVTTGTGADSGSGGEITYLDTPIVALLSQQAPTPIHSTDVIVDLTNLGGVDYTSKKALVWRLRCANATNGTSGLATVGFYNSVGVKYEMGGLTANVSTLYNYADNVFITKPVSGTTERTFHSQIHSTSASVNYYIWLVGYID